MWQQHLQRRRLGPVSRFQGTGGVSRISDCTIGEKSVKKTIAVLVVSILLPLSAFAARKKQAQQDSTDWLNAPTPDGSPTLKETSDWLARTLTDYGGDPRGAVYTVIQNVRIDNNCNFSFTVASRAQDNKSYHESTELTVPLGAVTDVHIEGVDGDGLTHLVEDAGYIAAHPTRLKPNGSGSFLRVDDVGILQQLGGFSVSLETGQVAAIHVAGRNSRGKSSEDSGNTISIDIGGYPATRPGAQVPQEHVQMLPRIVSAFQHAVSLCQSTYKTAAPAKEPF